MADPGKDAEEAKRQIWLQQYEVLVDLVKLQQNRLHNHTWSCTTAHLVLAGILGFVLKEESEVTQSRALLMSLLAAAGMILSWIWYHVLVAVRLEMIVRWRELEHAEHQLGLERDGAFTLGYDCLRAKEDVLWSCDTRSGVLYGYRERWQDRWPRPSRALRWVPIVFFFLYVAFVTYAWHALDQYDIGAAVVLVFMSVLVSWFLHDCSLEVNQKAARDRERPQSDSGEQSWVGRHVDLYGAKISFLVYLSFLVYIALVTHRGYTLGQYIGGGAIAVFMPVLVCRSLRGCSLEASQKAGGVATAYVCPGSKTYHTRRACRYLHGITEPPAMTVEGAENAGLTQCADCKRNARADGRR